MSLRLPRPLRFPAALPILALGLFSLTLPGSAATLGATAQSVMPSGTIQIVSVNYHRLVANPTAVQVEKQVLPPEMLNLTQLLKQGGLNPAQDLDRISFATYRAKTIGLMGVAEGDFQGLNLAAFFRKTPKRPHPPQFLGVDLYQADGISFFAPDSSTLVFGSRPAVETAIQTEQGVFPRLASNDAMTTLISGTQTSDVWSVLDSDGARTMVKSLLSGSGTKIDPALFEKHFDGARYTLSFDNPIQLNLELMTGDALTAATASAGLRAAILYQQYQQKTPALKALLNNVQVDAAGDHTFVQMTSDEQTVAALIHSDLFKTITR